MDQGQGQEMAAGDIGAVSAMYRMKYSDTKRVIVVITKRGVHRRTLQGVSHSIQGFRNVMAMVRKILRAQESIHKASFSMRRLAIK